MTRTRAPLAAAPADVTPLRALTLTCPWAHAVAYWGKNIENRVWAPPRDLFGQRLAIHAGKSPFRPSKDGKTCTMSEQAELDFDDAWEFIAERAPDGETSRKWIHERSSAVLCVATVAGWVRESGEYDLVTSLALPCRDLARSPWFVGPYGWVLTNVITLPEPVACKGAQGLWRLPPDVDAAVRALAGRAGGTQP